MHIGINWRNKFKHISTFQYFSVVDVGSRYGTADHNLLQVSLFISPAVVVLLLNIRMLLKHSFRLGVRRPGCSAPWFRVESGPES